MRNDVIQVILETFEETQDINIQKIWVQNDNEVFGLYTNHVAHSISFLSKPQNSIETEVDDIKISMFELGAILYHIYYKGWLKFVPFLTKYDNLIEPEDNFLKLIDYVNNNVPLHIAKHNIIQHINQNLENFNEKHIIFILDEILASFDTISNVVDIFNGDWDNANKVKVQNYLQDVKQILEHDCHPKKISEQTMHEIDGLYVKLVFDSDNI